ADKSKFTRKQSKTGKHGHENQKSTKRSQRIKAEARKVKPQSKSAKKSQRGVKSVISLLTLAHSYEKDTSSMEEAQVYVSFCIKSLSKEAQVSLKRIATLAIRVRSLIDPTAKFLAPMIG
ncbi:hypothetical protein Tco_0763024, partial [Tanacetum coccineum]